MKRKTLEEAVVALICDIDSRLIRYQRSPELNEYRRGFQEALTGLKNDVPMIDVVDALKAAGWGAPRSSWVSPIVLSPPTPEGDDDAG